MTMDTATAVDVIDVVLDELVTLKVLPVKRYEDMSAADRAKLVDLLVTRYGEADSGGVPRERMTAWRRKLLQRMQLESRKHP